MSDPIRVRMVGLMARAASGGRGCCGLPEQEAPGICVCEFMEYFGLAQSKASYHLGKLREAGLVSEQRQGRWSYYSLRHDALSERLGELAEYLGTDEEGGS